MAMNEQQTLSRIDSPVNVGAGGWPRFFKPMVRACLRRGWQVQPTHAHALHLLAERFNGEQREFVRLDQRHHR